MSEASLRVILSTGSLYVLDIAYAFELAAETGYDGIEVMCDDRYSTRDPDYLQRLSQRTGLPILVVHTPFSNQLMGWGGDGKTQIGRIRRTLKLAEAVGAESIVVHLPRYVGYGFVWVGERRLHFPWMASTYPIKRWIENDLPAIQAKTKVKIGIENMPRWKLGGFSVDSAYWNEVATWSRVHDYVTLDTTHWGTKSINPVDAYNAAEGRVCNIHLSNYDKGREHRLPHKGELDLASLLRRLVETNYSGTVCNELSPDALEFHEPRLLRKNLQDSLKFCREHLVQ